MSLPTFALFDQDLDQTIAERGRKYFRKGRVHELAETEDGVWRALVQGTEAYDTTITIKDGAIVHHRCNCPYDLGQYCKHELAVLYAICEQSGEPVREVHGENVPNSQQPKKRSALKQIEDATGNLTPEQLRQIVIEQAVSDQTLRARLVEATPSSDKVQTYDRKEEYIDIIRACMDDNADRHGFIGWHEAHEASRAAHELCGAAQRHLESKQYGDALPIGQALIEAIYPDLGHMDDSNGEFGSCIECGWEILRSIGEHVPPTSDIGTQLFNYCLKQAGRKEYDGWSVDRDFLSIAQSLTHSEERLEELFQIIDTVLLASGNDQDDDNLLQQTRDYFREQNAEDAARIKLIALRTLGKTADADALIQSTLAYPDIRELHLHDLVESGAYEKAKQIAWEGIERTKYPGIVRKFEEWLVTIAEKESDIETVQVFLKQFFLERMEMDAYRRWKQSYDDDRLWQKACEEIIRHLREKDVVSVLLAIFQEEDRWEDFRDCVIRHAKHLQKGGSHYEHAFTFLLRYEDEMMERFQDEFAPLALASIQPYLTKSTGRATYQEICRCLRRLRKRGYEDGVTNVCEKLRVQFKNRPALLEELEKVA